MPPSISYSYDRDRWVTVVRFPSGAYEYAEMSPYHYDAFLKRLRRNFGQAVSYLKKFPATKVESAGASR